MHAACCHAHVARPQAVVFKQAAGRSIGSRGTRFASSIGIIFITLLYLLCIFYTIFLSISAYLYGFRSAMMPLFVSILYIETL